MTVSVKIMSRTSVNKIQNAISQEGKIETTSTAYSTTLPLDFSREEAWTICDEIVSKMFPQVWGRQYKCRGQRIATLDGITESYDNNQYCFSVGGDIELVEEKEIEIDY